MLLSEHQRTHNVLLPRQQERGEQQPARDRVHARVLQEQRAARGKGHRADLQPEQGICHKWACLWQQADK